MASSGGGEGGGGGVVPCGTDKPHGIFSVFKALPAKRDSSRVRALEFRLCTWTCKVVRRLTAPP